MFKGFSLPDKFLKDLDEMAKDCKPDPDAITKAVRSAEADAVRRKIRNSVAHVIDNSSNTLHTATNDELRRVDEHQHRQTFTSSQLDAMIRLNAGKVLVMQALEDLEPLLKQAHAQWAKPLSRGIHTAAERIAKLMSWKQLRSMDNQLNHGRGRVLVTTDQTPQGCTNIRNDDLAALCEGTLEYCAMSCFKTREESRSCPKRQALETVPGLRGVEEIIDEDRCRYQLVTMEKAGHDD